MALPMDYSLDLTRMISFEDKALPNINCTEMVNSGFFYSGEGDMVECFSCQIRLHSWQSVDVVDIEHLTHSPSCLFMKKKLTLNSDLLLELVVMLLKDRIAARRELECVKAWITTPILGCADTDSVSFGSQSSRVKDEEGDELATDSDYIGFISDTSSESTYSISEI